MNSSQENVSEATHQRDLFVASFLALFLEVLLIRWVPSYERVLAYFTNFVLIAAFLGLGLGAMLTRWRRDLIRYESVLLLLLVTVSLVFSAFVKVGGAAEDVLYSDYARPAAVSLRLEQALILFFVIIAVVFVPLGQRIGADLKALSAPLRGYMLNIGGSLLGVVAFAVVSFLQLSPVWWFAIVFGLLLWFVRHERATLLVNAAVTALAIVAIWSAASGFIWSPYHKVAVTPLTVETTTGRLAATHDLIDPTRYVEIPVTNGFHVSVDDDFLQMALDLSDTSVARYAFLQNYRRQYDLPYSIPGFPYNNVLIVGAGTGNDTAAALRSGARHVDAVEIDPAIVALGKLGHPNRPYTDPRVRVWVDDARSFFNKTDRKYDLVVFGLLDSHRLFSSMSSVRLDSFVFTEESFREVSRLLNDHGIVVVQHGLGASFMGGRLYRMLMDVFAMPPQVLHIPEFPGLTFAAGPGVTQFLQPDSPKDIGPVVKATDDWPFLYLEGRALPREYLVALVVMLLVTVLSVLGCSGGKMRTVQPHFFLLGSGFLLIETLSVTRFALLFGSTWAVNSIVFSAILLVVLLANAWMDRIASVNTHLLYALLAASVLVNFLFPIHVLLRTALAVRLGAAMTLMGAPIFFAAFVFARSFKQTATPELAFASNLVGAVVGGLIEYSSLLIGFRNLLLIALAIYAMSYAALLLPGRVQLERPALH